MYNIGMLVFKQGSGSSIEKFKQLLTLLVQIICFGIDCHLFSNFLGRGDNVIPQNLEGGCCNLPKKKSGPLFQPQTFLVLALTWGALWPLRLIVTLLDWCHLKFIGVALKAHQFLSLFIGDPYFSTITSSPIFFLVRYVWFSSLFNFLSLVCNFQFVLLNCQFKDLFSQLQSWIIMSPLYHVIIF